MRLQKSTAFKIVIELIHLYQKLHSIGIVHNDLKLDNVLTSLEDPSQLVLIDFGMATSYLDDKGNHIELIEQDFFNGNLMFGSHFCADGIVPSRRDDIISTMNLLVYFLNGNKLPWSHDIFTKPNKAQILMKRADKRSVE